jgi:hypothetical protein
MKFEALVEMPTAFGRVCALDLVKPGAR